MKKICFYIFLIFAICLLFLFACNRVDSLYEIFIYVTESDKSLPAGKIMCYGNKYDDSISENTLSEYLGLSGYPGFKDRIEELVVYSSVKGNYCELAAIKLYRASDIPDAKLFFERRIKAVTRATNMSNIKSYTENAFI